MTTARLQFEIAASLIARHGQSVDRSGGPDACWPWMASFRNGYGAIKHRGRVLSASVVAYRLHVGTIADGMVVAHKCDNRGCCNPSHLECISAAQNNRDARDRLRFAACRGPAHPSAALTHDEVASVKRLAAIGFGPQKIIRLMGLTCARSTVRRAIRAAPDP